MTDINHQSHFKWQVQYLVTLECHFLWQAQYWENNEHVWFSFGSISKDIVSNVRLIYMIVDGVYSLNLI